MRRWILRAIDIAFFGLFIATVVGLLLYGASQPTLEQTAVYVIFVETPAIVVLAMLINAFITWRVRR